MTDVLPEPTLLAEVAFRTGASTGTLLHLDDPTRGRLNTGTLGEDTDEEPVWTEVAPWFRSGSITRASSRVESPIVSYETGTCSAVLDNSDRRFDPSNLSGPYVSGGVSQVTAMRAIRLRAEWAGVVYELFRGTADDWDVIWMDPDYSETTLTGSDAFKVLSGIDRPAVPAIGAGDTTGARINRVLDSVGWPAADREVATGDSTVQETTLVSDPLAELQLTAANEIGELYVDGGGRVVFRNRNALLQDTRSGTSQATFGDGDGAELPYTGLTVSSDGTTFYSQVRALRGGEGAVEQMVEDGAAQALFYLRTYRPSELILETDADVLAYAQWLLHVSRDPELRFTEIEIDPRLDPAALYPQVLGRQIGDRITIIRRPPGGGDPIQRDVFIRSVSHEIAQGSWKTKWALQSATKYGSFLTLDNSTLGVLNNNALAY